MIKKYRGSWSGNNEQTGGYGFYGSNKRKLAKEMKYYAQDNTYGENTGWWDVAEEIDSEWYVILIGKVKGKKI